MNDDVQLYALLRLFFLLLEALAVDDAGAGLVVLLLADPHLLECGEGGQDGATDPDRVLPLWRSDDLKVRREQKSMCRPSSREFRTRCRTLYRSLMSVRKL